MAEPFVQVAGGAWENWILLALLAAIGWAISCIIDVCFVGGRIFREPSDGPVITGLFCLIPLALLLPRIQDWNAMSVSVIGAASVAGLCYFLHVYFYFRALLAMNDGSRAEIFNNLCVLFVPVLAFILLGEELQPIYYLALGLALGGVLLLTRWEIAGVNRRATGCLVISVVCMSLSMVLQASVFDQTDYVSGISVFFLTTFVVAVLVTVSKRARRRRITHLCRRFGILFVGVQLLDMVAVMASQRATDMAPAVSLVAMVECALPVFVMAFSSTILLLSKMSRHVSTQVHDALVMQTSGWPMKLISLLLISGAIAIVHFGASPLVPGQLGLF
ncbi:MAG: hypothetical protein WBN78_01775 [Gammaproteobacteria bacterium]